MFPNDRKIGSDEPAHIKALRLHRHDGYDFIFITQHPGDLHVTVRRLVFRHEHFQRIFGSENSMMYWRDRTFDVDSRRERSDANQEAWTFPKELFGVYQSASMHVKHRRIPRGLKLYAGGAAILAVFIGYSAYNFFGSDGLQEATDKLTHKEGIDGEGATVKTSSGFKAAPTFPVLAEVMGCMWTTGKCQCYTTEGAPIDEEQDECRKRVAGVLPFGAKPKFSTADREPAARSGPTGPDRAGSPPGQLIGVVAPSGAQE